MSNAVAAPQSSSQTESALPAARYGLFLFTATLLIAAFYLYSALFLIVGSLAWFVVLLFGLLGSQYGGASLAWPALNALGAALKTFARGLRIGRGVEYHLTLERAQAPRLWEVVEDLSRQLGVAPPREFVLENGVNAYVMLRGLAAGRGKTRLGVGFDLLAGLSEAQARAVMAHEIAHAKYVRRGYQGFLMRGLFRLSRCAGALESIAQNDENPKAARAVSRWIGALPSLISKTAGRLIAACSRYDEFLADRVAAEICGPSPCRAALLTTHVLDYQADRIDYRERLLHLEREPGYAAWLRERLSVPDDAKRLELEARALERAQRHELSTHPALPDRLAAIDALEIENKPNQGAETGLVWLNNANQIAGLLLHHIERTAASAEAKSTQSLARWMRKHQREKGREALMNNEKLWALAMLAFAVFFGLVWWNFAREMLVPDAQDSVLATWAMIAAVAILPVGSLAAAIHLATKTPALAGALPIPPFVFYRDAQIQKRDNDRDARDLAQERRDLPRAQKRAFAVEADENKAQTNIARGAQLRAQLPAEIQKSAAIANFLIQQGYQALAQADYEGAAHCARLVFELDSKRGEALLMHALCAVARGWSNMVGAPETAAAAKMGAGGQWALAWIACLQGQTGVGEAYLLEQTRRNSKNAMLRALLAYCQAANGKPRESLASRKLALQLAQSNADLTPETRECDEACHRFVLAQNLTSLGQLTEARAELDWLDAFRARREKMGGALLGLDPYALDVEELKWRIARGETDAALTLAQGLAKENPAARHQIEIGDILADAREEPLRELAQVFLERALEIGFYPQVKMALSQLFFDREDKGCARTLLLESLDTTRSRPLDAPHPLSQLNSAIKGLRAIADAPPAKVEAWEISLDAKDLKLDIKQLFLLVIAPDEADARAQSEEIFAALCPGEPLEERVEIKVAPTKYQPDDPMPPGIYGARWDDE